MPRAFRSNFIPTHYIVLLRGLDTQKLPTCLKNVTHKMSFSRHVQMNKLSFNFDALLHLLPLRVLTYSRIFFFTTETFFLRETLFYVILIMIDFVALNTIENRSRASG